MSISSVGAQSTIPSLLLKDLQNSGLSSDTVSQVQSEIESVVQSTQSSSTSGSNASPTDIRAAIEAKLKEDVSSGALTQDQADQVTAALDQFDSQIKQSGGPGNGQGGPNASELFSKLDSDGDGKLTEDEFVSGRPKDVSEDQAKQLYAKIAEKGGGDASSGLSQDQFTAGFDAAKPDKDSDSATSTTTSSSTSTTSASSSGTTAPNPSDLFSKLDSDGDGKLTEDEFVSGRPKNMSEDQAKQLYAKIAEKGGGDASSGLTEDQFSSGFQAAAPAGGPPGGGGAPPAGGGGAQASGGGGGGSSSSGSSDEVVSVTTTTSADGTKTTVTKYGDGSTSTSVTYGQGTSSAADNLQSILKTLTQGNSDSNSTSSTSDYLSKLLKSGNLIDTVA